MRQSYFLVHFLYWLFLYDCRILITSQQGTEVFIPILGTSETGYSFRFLLMNKKNTEFQKKLKFGIDTRKNLWYSNNITRKTLCQLKNKTGWFGHPGICTLKKINIFESSNRRRKTCRVVSDCLRRLKNFIKGCRKWTPSYH